MSTRRLAPTATLWFALSLALGPHASRAVDAGSLRVTKRTAQDVELTWTDATPTNYCVLRSLAPAPPLALSGSTPFLSWIDTPGPSMTWYYDVQEAPTCAGSCGAAGDLACGSFAFAGDTLGAGSTNVVNVWPACGVLDATGPEQVWRFIAQSDVDVQVDLTDLAGGLDLLVLAETGAGCSPLDCITTGDVQVSFAAPAGSTWYVVVDGRLGAAGPYQLDLTCSSSNCTPTTTLACGASVAGATTDAGSTFRIDDWSPCSATAYAGPEIAWTFVASATEVVTASLGGLSADLDILVLEDTGIGCDAADCLVLGDDTVQFAATAGSTYYLVVDSIDPAGGSFVLDLACGPTGPTECSPIGPLTCGVATSGRTDDAGSTDGLDAWPCRPGDFSGSEMAFDLTVPMAGMVRATLMTGSAELDVFVVPAAGPCLPSACAASADAQATWMATAGSAWRVILDGPLPAAYTLVVTCPMPAASVCTSVGSITCGAARPGSTGDAGSTDLIDTYPCTGADLSGPERAWTFQATGTGMVTFGVTPEPGADLDVLVLAAPTSACDPAACLAHGDSSVMVDVVTGQQLFIVVDGPAPAGADFVLTSSCGFPQGPCSPAFDLACGQAISSSTTRPSATTGNTSYSCSGASAAGPEMTFAFVPDDPSRGGDVRIVLDNQTADLDLYVLENQGTGCDPMTCIAWGDDEVTFRREAGRQYFIVVDGAVAGDFRIFAAACLTDPLPCSPGAAIDCGTVLLGQGNGQAGSTDGIDTYTTCPGLGAPPDESGPEYAYSFTTATARMVTVSLSSVSPQALHVFALEDIGGGCDPTQCRAFGVNGVTFAAAAGSSWQVVVDGFRGAVSTYDLAVACTP